MSFLSLDNSSLGQTLPLGWTVLFRQKRGGYENSFQFSDGYGASGARDESCVDVFRTSGLIMAVLLCGDGWQVGCDCGSH
jgi:hypothetical protein